MPEFLKKAPTLPEHAAHVWAAFCTIHAERMHPDRPPSRITSTMLRDYGWETGAELELWERKAIRRIDAAFLARGKTA